MSEPLEPRKADARPDLWARDVVLALRASRRTAWTVALVATVVGIVEGLALAAIFPLKTVTPFTLTIDRATGFVSSAKGLAVGPQSQDAALTRAFLTQYVLNRESYDRAEAQAAAERVSKWSSGSARTQYVQTLAANHPLNPSATLPTGTRLLVTVKDVEILSGAGGRVRFEVERRALGENAGERRPFAAIIGFRYVGSPTRMEDRLINPLGFQVTSYRRDAETIGVASQ